MKIKNHLSFTKKSKTLKPSISKAIHIWPWKSNQSSIFTHKLEEINLLLALNIYINHIYFILIFYIVQLYKQWVHVSYTLVCNSCLKILRIRHLIYWFFFDELTVYLRISTIINTIFVRLAISADGVFVVISRIFTRFEHPPCTT